METLSGCACYSLLGKHISSLPGPWIGYIELGYSKRVSGKNDPILLNAEQQLVDWQVAPLLSEAKESNGVGFVC